MSKIPQILAITALDLLIAKQKYAAKKQKRVARIKLVLPARSAPDFYDDEKSTRASFAPTFCSPFSPRRGRRRTYGHPYRVGVLSGPGRASRTRMSMSGY